MTLRNRLLVTLLALALVPTALLCAFTLLQLDRAAVRWYRPGVDRALESALEITKSSAARLEGAALVKAGDWAADWPAGPLPERTRADLRAALNGSSLDFIQHYRREGNRWRRAEQIVPEGVLVANEPDLAAELRGPGEERYVLHSERGVLAGVARARDGSAIVAGLWVAPDFFARLDSVGQGMTYYRRLGITSELQRRTVLLLVGVVTVLLVLVAVVLSTVLAKQMARPLQDLSGAISRVAAGDLEARVGPAGASELRSLGESFNAMTQRLQSAREALQRAEREAAWREVARTLAHEFKNMLTPMKLSLQLLEAQLQATPAEQREGMAKSLELVLHEVESLNHLAGQFSQYARLPEPRFETLDAGEVARSAAALIPGARIEVEMTEPRAATIRADRVLLQRAVHNLALNAVEAGAAGGPVEIRVGSSADGVHVEVLDRGPGLPEDVRGRLFEPYVSTKRRGSGLGLSLVRDIARQHGGTVSLENREGGGARAVLVLPRSQPGGDQAGPAQATRPNPGSETT